MRQQPPSLKQLISSEEDVLHERLMKLRNRFAILVYLEDSGINWAIQAIDPTNDNCWKPDLYINAYETWNN